MTKVLVVHGAGMNMRGKVQVEIFGKMTMADYDRHIERFAKELGLEIEIFHSNVEGEVIDKFYEASEKGFDGAIFNPAGYSSGYPALVAALSQVPFPTVEVHISNPAQRGSKSDITRVAKSTVTGFGVAGYRLAFLGLLELRAKA